MLRFFLIPVDEYGFGAGTQPCASAPSRMNAAKRLDKLGTWDASNGSTGRALVEPLTPQAAV